MSGSHQLLIIEDEAKIAASLVKGLNEQGYSAMSAADGHEGLELFNQRPFDLVILDLMLPGIDGMELLQIIRSRNKNIPILVLTARDGLDDRIKGLDLGADDYLVKPFSFSELTARVRALTRRAFSSDYLYAADLKLDATRRTVIRSGKVILLSQKETDVLRILLEAKGQAVTREMMSRDLWNITHTVLDNNIDVAISGLRRKIDQDFKDKLIETVRGVGFRIRE